MLSLSIPVLQDVPELQVEYVEEEYNLYETEPVTYDTYKMSIILTDNLGVIVNNHFFNSMQGDILLFRPGEVHFARFFCRTYVKYINFLIPVNFFDSFADVFEISKHIFSDRSKNRLNQVCLSEKERLEILRMTNEIVNFVCQNATDCCSLIFSSFLRILHSCGRVYEEQKKQVQKNVSPMLIKSLLYLSEHHAEDITLASIAQETGCSVTYLTRLFKKYTGKTVYQYLIDFRITHAKQLLCTGHSVAETCYASGFGDCSNFIKTFKQIEGITPYQYSLSYRTGKNKDAH